MVRKVIRIATAKEFRSELTGNVDTAGKKYIQTANIDFGQRPVRVEKFSGLYDGQCFTLSNYKVVLSGTCDGLFANVDGEIRNVNIQGVDINPGDFNVTSLSAFVGRLYSEKGIVFNVSVGGITSDANRKYFGAVVGQADPGSTIAFARTNKDTLEINSVFVGGICGFSDGAKIYGCENRLQIEATGEYVGGICGATRTSFLRCCVNRATLKGGNFCAGISVDLSDSIITSCLNVGELSGIYVAGIAFNVRNASLTLTDCFSAAKITSSSSKGFHLTDNATVTNSYYQIVAGSSGLSATQPGINIDDVSGPIFADRPDWHIESGQLPDLVPVPYSGNEPWRMRLIVCPGCYTGTTDIPIGQVDGFVKYNTCDTTISDNTESGLPPFVSVQWGQEACQVQHSMVVGFASGVTATLDLVNIEYVPAFDPTLVFPIAPQLLSENQNVVTIPILEPPQNVPLTILPPSTSDPTGIQAFVTVEGDRYILTVTGDLQSKPSAVQVHIVPECGEDLVQIVYLFPYSTKVCCEDAPLVPEKNMKHRKKKQVCKSVWDFPFWVLSGGTCCVE